MKHLLPLLRSLSCSFGWILVVGCLLRFNSTSVGGESVPPNQQALLSAQLVRQALQREISGANSERGELLQQAIDQNPDFAPARWHTGHVRVGNQWISIDDVPTQATNHQQLLQYRRRRSRTRDTVWAQLGLAEWCLQQGLTSQARAHFTKVLELEPDHVEARTRLGFRQVDGGWIGPEELREARQRAAIAARGLVEWKPKLIELAADIGGRKKLLREQALKEVNTIQDPAAILAFELVFSRYSPQLADLAVDQFARMKTHQASTAIARQALSSPWPSIRQAAANKLKDRPLEHYVPVLLAAMHTPLQARWELYQTPSGRLRHRQSYFREGQEHKELAVFDTDYGRGSGINDGLSALGTVGGRTSSQQSLVARDTAITLAINHAVCELLAEATQQPLPPDPKQWWAWWREYNEVYVKGPKPTQRRYEHRDEYGKPIARTDSGHERESCDCLAAGTPVWTERGLTAVERLSVGDLLLSQHPETGALAYRPVLRTTIRPTGKLLRITVGGETFECSGGHPFWVSGFGWKKARQLATDDQLHRLTGAEPITEIRTGSTAKTYNVIVADFHTLFIGKHKLLSHDNTIRRPTNAVVPGLIPQ